MHNHAICVVSPSVTVFEENASKFSLVPNRKTDVRGLSITRHLNAFPRLQFWARCLCEWAWRFLILLRLLDIVIRLQLCDHNNDWNALSQTDADVLDQIQRQLEWQSVAAIQVVYRFKKQRIRRRVRLVWLQQQTQVISAFRLMILLQWVYAAYNSLFGR